MISARDPLPPVSNSRIQAMLAPPGQRVVDRQGAIATSTPAAQPAPSSISGDAQAARPSPAGSDTDSASASAGGCAQQGVRFVGTRADYAGMLARGSLLTLITLGLYRFWLMTDIRRHLYANTIIAGEPLEYAGFGGELLRGFLIGMTVLIPINLITTMLGITSIVGTVSLGILLFLSMAGLKNFAEFRTYAYRINRTRYRGIPGSLDADVFGYVKRCYAWDFAVFLSFGLAAPFRRASLDRYLIGNSRLGDQKARFSGTGSSLAQRVYLAWAILALAWLVITSEKLPILSTFIMEERSQLWPLSGLLSRTWYTILAAMIIGFTFYTVYVAILQRWRLDHLSFGETRFVSRLPVWRVFFCYLCFGAGVIAIFYLALTVTTTVSAFLTQHYPVESRALFGTWKEPTMLRNATMIVSILLILTLIGAMRRYFVERGVWIAVMSTLSVSQPQELIGRLRYSKPSSAGAGEGLADAFTLGP